MGEVDRLAHLAVCLRDGLSGLGRHDLDQAVAVRGEREPGAMQHCGTLGARLLSPRGAKTRDRLDNAVQDSNVIDAGGRHGVDTQL